MEGSVRNRNVSESSEESDPEGREEAMDWLCNMYAELTREMYENEAKKKQSQASEEASSSNSLPEDPGVSVNLSDANQSVETAQAENVAEGTDQRINLRTDQSNEVVDQFTNGLENETTGQLILQGTETEIKYEENSTEHDQETLEMECHPTEEDEDLSNMSLEEVDCVEDDEIEDQVTDIVVNERAKSSEIEAIVSGEHMKETVASKQQKETKDKMNVDQPGTSRTKSDASYRRAKRAAYWKIQTSKTPAKRRFYEQELMRIERQQQSKSSAAEKNCETVSTKQDKPAVQMKKPTLEEDKDSSNMSLEEVDCIGEEDNEMTDRRTNIDVGTISAVSNTLTTTTKDTAAAEGNKRNDSQPETSSGKPISTVSNRQARRAAYWESQNREHNREGDRYHWNRHNNNQHRTWTNTRPGYGDYLQGNRWEFAQTRFGPSHSERYRPFNNRRGVGHHRNQQTRRPPQTNPIRRGSSYYNPKR